MAAPNLALMGSLIGDPTRVVMLETLLDGRAWTAGELARAAGVTPQTASNHLLKLLQAGLLSLCRQGRHRYYRLASAEVAQVLETLAVLSTHRQTARPEPVVPAALRTARTCYDHLAGQLGVALTRRLAESGCLQESDERYLLSESGAAWFGDLGVDTQGLTGARRVFARRCLDWSERRFHLGGALGAALTGRLFELNWLRRVAASRAVEITRVGRRELDRLGISGY